MPNLELINIFSCLHLFICSIVYELSLWPEYKIFIFFSHSYSNRNPTLAKFPTMIKTNNNKKEIKFQTLKIHKTYKSKVFFCCCCYIWIFSSLYLFNFENWICISNMYKTRHDVEQKKRSNFNNWHISLNILTTKKR